MTPIVFINCTEYPYVHAIMAGLKTFESRNRRTLDELIGKRVMIAETGHGKPIVRCWVTIGEPVRIENYDAWEVLRNFHRVPYSSHHEWNQDTKRKYLYILRDVHEVEPFIPPKGKRHGRVWMEYNEKR